MQPEMRVAAYSKRWLVHGISLVQHHHRCTEGMDMTWASDAGYTMSSLNTSIVSVTVAQYVVNAFNLIVFV